MFNKGDKITFWLNDEIIVEGIIEEKSSFDYIIRITGTILNGYLMRRKFKDLEKSLYN